MVEWDISVGSYEFVRKLCEEGRLHEAVGTVELMSRRGMQISKHILYCLLQGCINHKDLVVGRKVQCVVTRNGFVTNTFLGSHLIRMFAVCGSLLEANQVFQKLPQPNIYPWSAIISAHAKLGEGKQAINLYHEMQQSNVKPDEYAFVAVLKACANTASLTSGKLIHADIIECGFLANLFVGNTLVDMYAKCGSLKDAHKVFDELPKSDVVSWSAIIAGYVQNGHIRVALQLFSRMRQEGMGPNVVTWNAMIAGYAQKGDGHGALGLFHEMQQVGVQPDDSTFVSILKAFSGTAALYEGTLIHAYIIKCGLEQDVCVGSALITMYAKHGNLADACSVFGKLQKHDVVTWSAMITAYAQNGHVQEALTLFHQMQQEDKAPDVVTFVSILKTCSEIGALNQGRLIHERIVVDGCESDAPVASSLIQLYAKCGSLEDVYGVCKRLWRHSLETWTAMIAGYTLHCNYKLALESFWDLQHEGLKPDEVTFLCLLCLCSQGGLVEEGCQHFVSMTKDYGMTPKLEHYNILVDILGRAGYLNEAEGLLTTMPFQSDIVGWTSLLSHCKRYTNVELGRRCFELVVAMDDQYASAYVLMLDVCCDSVMWEDAKILEELRRCARANKKPGKAFIEIENKLHDFVVGDESHPQNVDIYEKLKKLSVHFSHSYIPYNIGE